jgi:hypothetical protein
MMSSACLHNYAYQVDANTDRPIHEFPYGLADSECLAGTVMRIVYIMADEDSRRDRFRDFLNWLELKSDQSTSWLLSIEILCLSFPLSNFKLQIKCKSF